MPQILPYYQDFFGINATIRMGQEILCLPLAGFYDPEWEVDHKVELEVDIKETDDMASEINFIFKPSLNIRFK